MRNRKSSPVIQPPYTLWVSSPIPHRPLTGLQPIMPSKYNLQVYSDNSIAENASLDAGESLVANESFDAENVTHGNLCSELLSVYLPDGIYFWHVQACNDGVCGYWSQWQYCENICAIKPDEAQENKVTAEKGMRPEKDTVEKRRKQRSKLKRRSLKQGLQPRKRGSHSIG